MGGSDGTGNGGLLLLGAVLDALAGKVGGTTLACLEANHQPSVNISLRTKPRTEDVEHDGGLGVASGLEGGDHGAAGGDVCGGDGKALLAGVGEELQNVLACPMSIPILRCRRGASYRRGRRRAG